MPKLCQHSFGIELFTETFPFFPACLSFAWRPSHLLVLGFGLSGFGWVLLVANFSLWHGFQPNFLGLTAPPWGCHFCVWAIGTLYYWFLHAQLWHYVWTWLFIPDGLSLVFCFLAGFILHAEHHRQIVATMWYWHWCSQPWCYSWGEGEGGKSHVSGAMCVTLVVIEGVLVTEFFTGLNATSLHWTRRRPTLLPEHIPECCCPVDFTCLT